MTGQYRVPGKGIQAYRPPDDPPDDLAGYLSKPYYLEYNGERTPFYRIGDLARALNRRPVTIRKWQAKGYIPLSRFNLPADILGGRIRLYTRDQIEAARQIAREEGILDDTARSITRTRFSARVFAAWKELG